MYSSEIFTAVDPRPHLMISIDGGTRHLGPHKKGCLRASKQLNQTPTVFVNSGSYSSTPYKGIHRLVM